MMFSTDRFATSATPATDFRQAFFGCSVEMADGRMIAASRVSNRDVREFMVSAVWDRAFEQWVTADRVALG